MINKTPSIIRLITIILRMEIFKHESVGIGVGLGLGGLGV
jgi:hypothetical protein